MGISSQWWDEHGKIPGESTDLKHDRAGLPGYFSVNKTPRCALDPIEVEAKRVSIPDPLISVDWIR